MSTATDELEAHAGLVAGALRAIGNESRLLILCKLARHGEMSAGSLTGTGGLSQSALSQHLARLREDGIITFRREGQTLWYSIADNRVDGLMNALRDLYCERAS